MDLPRLGSHADRCMCMQGAVRLSGGPPSGAPDIEDLPGRGAPGLRANLDTRKRLMASWLSEDAAGDGAVLASAAAQKLRATRAASARMAGASVSAFGASATSPTRGCVNRAIEIEMGTDPVRHLGGQTRINLGARDTGSTIERTVPCDYLHTSTRREMLESFLPDFLELRDLEWSEYAANIVTYQGTTEFGLFWDDGWGYMHQALLYALVLIRAHGGESQDLTGTTGYDPAVISSAVHGRRLNLVVGGHLPLTRWGAPRLRALADGTFEVRQGSGPYYAITYGQRIHIADIMTSWAASADYLFWWAQRLHSRWVETLNIEDFVVGQLCARAALADVATIASIVVHEYWHKHTAHSFHCKNLTGTSHDCAAYAVQYTFLMGVVAVHALPMPANGDGGQGAWYSYTNGFSTPPRARNGHPNDIIVKVTYSGVNQIDGDDALILIVDILSGIGVLNYLNDWLSIDTSDSCGSASYSFTHENFWEAGHDVHVDWFVPERCSRDASGSKSGGVTWHPGW